MNGQTALSSQADGAAPAAEAPARRHATTVEDLRNGWRMIANAWIGGTLIHVVLIQPGAGIVLMQIHPHWTPEALDLLRRLLEESGFAEARPGHLPAIHRRLRPEDVPNLDFILADAFIWQDPITLAPDSGWEEALTGLLAPGLHRPAPPPEPAPPAAMVPPPRPAWRGRVLVASAALAAGLAALALIHRDRWAPPREAPPGQALAARSSTPFLAGAEATPAPPAAEPPALPVPAMVAPRPEPEAPPPAIAEWPEPPAPPPAEAGQRPILLAALTGWPAAPPGAEPAILLPVLRVAEPPLAEALVLPGEPHAAVPPPPVAAPLPALRGPPSDLTLPPIRLADASGLGSLALAAPALTVPEASAGLPDLPRGLAPPAGAALPVALRRPARPAPVPPAGASDPLPALPAAPLRLAVAPAARPVPPPTSLPAPPPGPGAVILAQAPSPAPKTPAAPLSPHLEAWRLRGEEMLGRGDISGARRLLEPAARAGSAAAAQSLAETYDPLTLAQRGVIGLPPDRVQALFWYRRAAALGAAVAPRIASLEAEP